MKFKMTKSLCLLVIAAFMIPVMAGCGSKKAAPSTGDANQKVTLRIYAQYSSDDEKQPYDYAVAKMKQVMPNVSLDLEIMAQDDDQKIKTYAATNNLPDIFVATTDVIETFKKSNNILQLDSYVKDLGLEDKLNQSSISLLKDDQGHTWAIPDAGQFAAVIYYNKSVFTKYGVKVPTNYDEFLSAVKTFKANGIIPLALFAKEKWPGVQLFDMIASREDPQGMIKLDKGQASVTDPAYTDAANKIVELVKAGLLPKGVFNLSSDDASALLKAGKAAMYLSGAWGMKDLGTAMGDNVGIMYAPFANAADADNVKWNISGGGYNSGLGVSAKSKYKDIAAKYACQFALYFAEGRIIKRGDPNPILKETLKPESGYLPIQQQYVDDSQNFKTMTCFDWGLTNPTFKAGVEDEVNKLLTGDYSVSDFQKNLQKSVQQ